MLKFLVPKKKLLLQFQNQLDEYFIEIIIDDFIIVFFLRHLSQGYRKISKVSLEVMRLVLHVVSPVDFYLNINPYNQWKKSIYRSISIFNRNRYVEERGKTIVFCAGGFGDSDVGDIVMLVTL